ncbi:Mss4p nuclear export [Umbelopsis sp. WA50703]
MSKRKAEEPKSDHLVKISADSDDEEQESEIIDVDFDFFDLDPIDFHAVKKLLSQLFSADAELLDLSGFSDVIINQTVGSTVKVDGKESDPYALLTVVNSNMHKDNAGVKGIVQYIMSKCPIKDTGMRAQVAEILQPREPNQNHDVGLVISERLINMPVQIMPPMYNMLLEEMSKANSSAGGFNFEWYVFISKTFKEVASTIDDEDDRMEEPVAQKKKKAKTDSGLETNYFQPEDEIIATYADIQFDYKQTNADKEVSSDARRAFSEMGIAPGRRVMFVRASKLKPMIEELEQACAL